MLLAASGVLGASGVALGAASAHLGGGDFGRLASEFLLFHAAAIPGILAICVPSGWVGQLAASMMVIGAVCFSGDLAYLGFVGRSPVSGLAPFGGLTLIAAWLVIVAAAVGVFRQKVEIDDKTV
ncbi:DUF423 domain-containing protein [Lichenifustis flavocetrariae]|uniref:DUF423 domain-containing protein n=1 Tax=Lichenifustis flavocetrariae TaxID=2949735 RepID=A0AA42CPV7_9HYPH|nr:DUF423 domain-containing protein [Lichenifustis flavocetrariae]MCW6510805.1 DUF423 domain-containing protein [Lichenifustis flavocetrariae]